MEMSMDGYRWLYLVAEYPYVDRFPDVVKMSI